jgi:hypothetical protein
MATRTKSVNAYRAVSVRGRDAGLPSEPIRVSDEARSKSTNATGVQKFGSPVQDRNVLAERPNTSGGPSPHFSARRETERRRAKDDLHFSPHPTYGGVMSYTVPLPGALPWKTIRCEGRASGNWHGAGKSKPAAQYVALLIPF